MLLLAKVINVILHPSKFFEDLKKEKGITSVFTYLAVLLALCMIMAILLDAALTYLSIGIDSDLLNIYFYYTIPRFLSFYTAELASTFILAGLFHIWIKAFRGKGTYNQTYQFYTYSITPLLIFISFYIGGWVYIDFSLYPLAEILIRLLGISIFIYTLTLLIKGTQIIHGIEKYKELPTFLLAVNAILMLIIFIIYTAMNTYLS